MIKNLFHIQFNPFNSLLILGLLCSFNAHTQTIDEYQLKAVYIEKITGFIQKKSSSQSEKTKKPIVLGIYGNGEINDIIIDVYENWTMDNRNVQVKEIFQVDNISKCDILFVNYSARKKIKDIVENCNEHEVILFGDSENYAKQGVHFNFYMENQRVHFEINEESLNEAGFKVNSLLLDYGNIVSSEGEE